MLQFEIESTLGTSPESLWAHSTTPSGVNSEFWPLLRMTFPDGAHDFSEAWRPGVRLFRSWILLFGFLPVDYDDLTLVEVEPGKRFLERSSMATQHLWQHERTLIPVHGQTVLRDRIAFEAKIPALAPIHRFVFHQVFRYRHYRLSRIFPTSRK